MLYEIKRNDFCRSINVTSTFVKYFVYGSTDCEYPGYNVKNATLVALKWCTIIETQLNGIILTPEFSFGEELLGWGDVLRFVECPHFGVSISLVELSNVGTSRSRPV